MKCKKCDRTIRNKAGACECTFETKNILSALEVVRKISHFLYSQYKEGKDYDDGMNIWTNNKNLLAYLEELEQEIKGGK